MTLQFKIQIRGISKPPVWRRIVIPGDFNFHDFHNAIQKAFGWWDEHLYQFQKTPRNIDWILGIPDEDDFWVEKVEDSREINVASFIKSKKLNKFVYVYDLGDEWVHDITLEETDEETTLENPICLAGKGACPPEDCGGAWGYEDMKLEMSKSEINEFSLLEANKSLAFCVSGASNLVPLIPQGQSADGTRKGKTLLDILQDYRKEDLLDQADLLELKLDSKASEKETRELFAKAVTDNIEKVLSQLTTEDSKILETLLEKPTPDCSVTYYDNFHDPMIVVWGFAEMCMDNEGDTYVLVASDFWKAAKPYIKKVQSKEEVQFRMATENFIIGLTNLYGQVSIKFVKQEMVRLEMAKSLKEAEDLVHYIFASSLWLKNHSFIKEFIKGVIPESLLFLSPYGWERPLQLEKAIADKGLATAAPKQFTMLQILEASLAPIPIIPNPKYDSFVDMLIYEMNFSDEEALDICHQLWYREMHEGDEDFYEDTTLEYFIDSVLYEYDENDYQYKRAMDQLKSFLDYMPRWQMKGQARKKTESGLSLKKESTIVNATSSDYVTMPVILKKAPGRNDLCPCGSGKKYKKCCGREN